MTNIIIYFLTYYLFDYYLHFPLLLNLPFVLLSAPPFLPLQYS